MSGMKETAKVLPLPGAPETPALAMLQALPDALLAVMTDGRILFSNHGAQAFFGMGEKALGGKTLAALLGDDSTAHEAMLSGQAITLHDITLTGKPVASLSAVPMEEGWFMLVIRPDTLPSKNGWTAKIKNSIKPAQHLARMLAHEIKNPLSGIRGAAQLLATSVPSPDDRELAELIATETSRVFRLIDKVNVFDDAPQEQYALVNLHAVMEHVEKIARSGFAGVTIHRRYDPSLPDIHGHYDRLVQAVLNLVKNAAEAGAQEVTLHTSYEMAAGFHPESRARLPVCVTIEDNGTGIDAETKKTLFEPYHTTKPGGDGLGLAVVSKIIDDHGGAVDVSSRPGKTLFKLNFPRGDGK